MTSDVYLLGGHDRTSCVEDVIAMSKACDVQITLDKANTSGNDQYLKPLWDDRYILAIHCQDHRLTWLERKILAMIGQRLYGRRAIY